MVELKTQLQFERDTNAQKDEDIEQYKYELQQLKFDADAIQKKLDHQIGLKQKHSQMFEAEKEKWSRQQKEWQQLQSKWHDDAAELKKCIKRLRDDVQRKETVIKQVRDAKEKLLHKLEDLQVKSRSSSTIQGSEQFKELQRDLEHVKNVLRSKENLLSELQKKRHKLAQNCEKLQTEKQDLQSKLRSVNGDISRKEVMINELRQKLQSLERDDECHQQNTDLIEKLRVKCKTLKSNEMRKDELWRANKEKLDVITKELQTLKEQNSRQSQNKLAQQKMQRIQTEEESVHKKRASLVQQEADAIKLVVQRLYTKLNAANNELMSTLNEKQKAMAAIDEDDDTQNRYTLKAAKILNDFSVNELEEIMLCKKDDNDDDNDNNSSSNEECRILWDRYEDKTFVIEWFDKVIRERIRLELMIDKLSQHQSQTKCNDNNNLQSDQFQKIKMKHKQHINEYRNRLKKLRNQNT